MSCKVLVLGKQGQLGWELLQTQPKDFTVRFCGRDEIDLTNIQASRDLFVEFAPHVVINAAAYTAVDRAESDRKSCYAVNTVGVEQLAKLCVELKAKLIHISTDFVFFGDKGVPCRPDDKANPIGVYGSSKRDGELAIQCTLGGHAVIIRTSWLYSTHGSNFVKTMLRLMAEKEQLGVVCDQVGTPTYARSLARLCWKVASWLHTDCPAFSEPTTIAHWSDAGVASWYDFAVAIQREALHLGLLDTEIPIDPISTESYPTPAKRPHYSVLDKASTVERFKLKPLHWQKCLSDMLRRLQAETTDGHMEQDIHNGQIHA